MLYNTLYKIIKENDLVLIEIIDGDFKGIKYFLDDPAETNDGGISYNYNVISGEIPLELGEKFLSLTKNIVNDIIQNIEIIQSEI